MSPFAELILCAPHGPSEYAKIKIERFISPEGSLGHNNKSLNFSVLIILPGLPDYNHLNLLQLYVRRDPGSQNSTCCYMTDYNFSSAVLGEK